MSGFHAVAGVSTTLRTLLRDRMELPGSITHESLVSIGTPAVPQAQNDGEPAPETPRINLFLYQVNENAFLKNRDAPGQGSSLSYGAPPLSVNLNYFITAYGTTVENEVSSDLLAQLLLGSAMRVLHDYSVLTPQMQTVRVSPIGRPVLDDSLRDAYEDIKLYLDPITLDDLTKVWTALTIPYRLSVAYSVTVVQIESQKTRRYPRLVGEPPVSGPGIRAIPLQRPTIAALAVRRPTDAPDTERPMPYARIGDTLIINGDNFSGEAVAVEINGLRIPATPLSGRRIEVTVPDTTLEGETIPFENRLQPGAQPVEVLTELGVGTWFRSNRATFMLVPRIMSVTTGGPRRLTINGSRVFAPDANMQTLIGPVLFPGDSYESAASDRIELLLPDVLPHRSAACFVGGPVINLAALDSTPEIDVTIAGDGPHRIDLDADADMSLSAIATDIQTRLRAARPNVEAFAGVRVTVLDDRLVILPGGLQGTVQVAPAGAAVVLGLDSGRNRSGYLSGPIGERVELTNQTPAVNATLDGDSFDAALGATPRALPDAADALEAALRGGPNASFNDTLVTIVGSQLLILTGNDNPIIFAGTASDDTTVAELHLRREYALRVRVNGAESIGDVDRIELPI